MFTVPVLLFSRQVVSDTVETPLTVARQAPLSMAFSRQEYWSGLPCPPPRDLPDSGIEPECPTWQADSLFTIIVYYRKRILLKVSKGKRKGQPGKELYGWAYFSQQRVTTRTEY